MSREGRWPPWGAGSGAGLRGTEEGSGGEGWVWPFAQGGLEVRLGPEPLGGRGAVLSQKGEDRVGQQGGHNRESRGDMPGLQHPQATQVGEQVEGRIHKARGSRLTSVRRNAFEEPPRSGMTAPPALHT